MANGISPVWLTVVVLAACFVIYTYALYPLAIHLLGRRRSASTSPAGAASPPEAAGLAAADHTGLPPVAIIIVARNEADRIAAKLASCVALDYPPDRLSVTVAVDGPDNGTAAAVRAFGDPRVVALPFDTHRGKAACLNDAVADAVQRTGASVILMTDARQRLDRAALHCLVTALAEPGVGAVSGELMFEIATGDGTGQGIDAYWRYEKFIRRAESAAGSVVGVTGALYAIRHEAWQPLPAGTILDDVLVPMRAVMAGWRVRFESRAIAWDRPSPSLADERSRKIRTLAGNLQLIALEPSLLSPRRNPILLPFLSHKLFRLLVPFALLALLIGSAVLTPAHPVFAALLGAQLLGYGLALAGHLRPALRSWLPVRLATTFVAMNVFAVLGIVAWLRDADLARWGKATTGANSDPAQASQTMGPRDARRERVVYLVSLFPCWSETFIVREIEALLQLGVDIRIVSLKPASETLVQPDAERLLDRVVYPPAGLRSLRAVAGEVWRAPWRSISEVAGIVAGLARRPMELVKTLGTWWRTLAVADTVRRLAPDHLHAHWATYPSTAAWILARRLGRPWSFTGHAHDIFAHDHFLRNKLAGAAFAVTISEFNRRLIGSRLPAAPLDRLHVVHCGVRLPELPFQPDGRQPMTILAVGRLDPIKGFRYLIEACRILRDRGRAVRCTIIGEGPLRAELAAAIAAAGLDATVQLAGAMPQDAVRRHLAEASVFVLPSVMLANSDADGIPVAMMEAMASGLPVVSTRVSGIPELIRDEVDGLLAPTEDRARLPDELANRIERLLADPALAARVAAAGRQRIEAGFDAAREGARLLELIRGTAASEASTAPRQLRLLLVTDEMEVGGSQRQIVQLARGLDPDDVSVTVAWFRNPSFLVDELRAAGIRTVEIPKRGRIDPAFVRALTALLRDDAWDIVHCYSFTAELWVALARRLLPASRRPVLITSVRGVYEWYNRPQWWVKRWVSGQSRAVISNSRGGAEFAARQMGWPVERLRVIPNGVPPRSAEPAEAARRRRALLPDDAGVLLLFVGRLVEHKNLPRLIAAFATARRDLPGQPLHLALAGDGPLRDDLAATIAHHGLQDNVTLLGESNDVPVLMAAADLVVLPSLREGLSNVILEAMMAGRPVIASTAGGNPEAVIDHETGLTFPPRDEAALAAAIRTLASDAALRREMGARGQARALATFTPAAMTRATREEYRLACDR